MKKALSLFLALVMVASLSLVVFAAAPTGKELAKINNGLDAVVIMKPDDKGVSKLQWIFTEGIDISGYECAWYIGYFNAEGNYVKWNPDSDAIADDVMHWSSPEFKWFKNDEGRTVFENVMHISATENGSSGAALNEGEETYATMYEKAAQGKLFACMGEYSNSHNKNGKVDCDPDNGVFDANYKINERDYAMVRVVTEEQHNSGLKTVLITEPDEKGVSKVQFVFNDSVPTALTGYNCAWGVGYYKADGTLVSWNCDNDALEETKWDHEDFKWFTNEDGNLVFQAIFHISATENGTTPERVLNEEGENYATMYDKAKDGKLVAYFGDYGASHFVNGYVDCDPNAWMFRANGAQNNGRDMCIADVVCVGAEQPDEPTTPDQPSNPGTGDTMIASLAIVALASAGAVLVLNKKH